MRFLSIAEDTPVKLQSHPKSPYLANHSNTRFETGVTLSLVRNQTSTTSIIHDYLQQCGHGDKGHTAPGIILSK